MWQKWEIRDAKRTARPTKASGRDRKCGAYRPDRDRRNRRNNIEATSQAQSWFGRGESARPKLNQRQTQQNCQVSSSGSVGRKEEYSGTMTICIAASCDDGQSVVVASDRMLSAPFLTVEFDHPDAKIDQIDNRCVALSAGDALCVQDVLIGGLGAASQLQNPSIRTLAEQIKRQFCDVRKQLINDHILGPRGIYFDSFYKGGMIG